MLKFQSHFILFIFSLCFATMAMGQEDQVMDKKSPNAMIRASFLFQFAKQSNWTVDNNTAKFVVAVYADQQVFNHLSKKYATQPIGKQTLNVLLFNELRDLQDVNILFVDKEHMKDFEKIKQYYQGMNTMIVTEVNQALLLGSMINFIIVNNETRIEIDNNEAIKRKITIGKKLLEWSENN